MLQTKAQNTIRLPRNPRIPIAQTLLAKSKHLCVHFWSSTEHMTFYLSATVLLYLIPAYWWRRHSQHWFRMVNMRDPKTRKGLLLTWARPGIVSAPLWSSETQRFAGMLTVSNFINLIQYYYMHSSVEDAMQDMEKFEIRQLRDVEKRIGAPAPQLIAMHPMSTLYDACHLLAKSRAHRVPLLDRDDTGTEMIVSVITQYRILKFIAVNVRKSRIKETYGRKENVWMTSSPSCIVQGNQVITAASLRTSNRNVRWYCRSLVINSRYWYHQYFCWTEDQRRTYSGRKQYVLSWDIREPSNRSFTRAHLWDKDVVLNVYETIDVMVMLYMIRNKQILPY